MFYFVEFFSCPGQALQFTAQFPNVLRFQLNWLNITCLPFLFSLTTGFNVCNQNYRILEKPSAWIASPRWLFSPTFAVSPSESILPRSWNIMRKDPFVLKKTWQSFGDWFMLEENKNDLPQIPDFLLLLLLVTSV